MKMHPSIYRALALIGGLLLASQAHATNYYVSNSGNNSNSGTSSSSPWSDFTNVNGHTFVSGDNLYLASGSSWNQEMDLQGGGSSSFPVNVTSYGSGSPAIISRSNGSSDICIKLTNGSHWKFSMLEICNADVGIQVIYTSGTFGNGDITINNNYFHNIDVNSEMTYSTAIEFLGDATTLPSSSQWTCNGINILNNYFSGIYVPIQTNQSLTNGTYISGYSSPYCWQNLVIQSNSFNNCGFQSAFWGITNALLLDNSYYNISGNDGHSHGGGMTGVFNEFTNQVTFANNWCDYVLESGSNDETWVDQESFNNDTNLYSNFIQNTAGAGIELLQLNGDGPSNYSTNITVDGNIFENNGAINSSQTALMLAQDNPSSGTVENNIYSLPPGVTWENSTSSWSYYTQSNNNSVPLPVNIYNAAAGFSSTEGTNQWSYVYWPGSGGVSNLTFNSSNTYQGSNSTGYWSDPNGASVSQFDMVPDSNSSYWLYRAWTAPFAGTVSVRGRVLKAVTGGGTLRVCITTAGIVWPAGGSPQNLGGSDQSGYDTDLDGISVSAGDVIAFCINNSSGTASNATVSWMPTIAYTSGGSANLLTNPGFENGLTGWTANACTSIALDNSNAHSGTAGCLASGRSQTWGSSMQDITSILIANGQGNYSLSGWLKFASGTDGAFLVIKLTDSSGTHFVTTSTVTVGTTYTQLSTTGASITWTGTLSSAYLFADDNSSLTDIYVDDFSLTKP